ncbi:MAG TPA: DUF885 family protein, partial [Sphingomicrobium sp.]|nr:DUF885 family protein [Sphingomicrobium sp.]
MSDYSFSRRGALAALASTAAYPLVSGCARTFGGTLPQRGAPAAAAPTEAQALGLLQSIAENLLRLFPEQATTLGIDNGSRAALRDRLKDRSPAGQQQIAEVIAADLRRANAIDAAGLSHSTRTSVDVVRSAYSTALEGLALPYGDVPVGYDSWRNSPYVVIQNTGAYLDVPRFLDAEHQINSVADAEAYLSRLAQFPRELDGELMRLQAARARGLVAPSFTIDKALEQLRASAKGAREGGGLVESIARRTNEKGIAGSWAARARAIAAQQVAPALERQIAELEAQRALATDIPGMWSRPGGPEYYRWAVKASTTTSMTPDEIHQLGVDTLRDLHSRMDAILKRIGYTRGGVGARMQALAKDPKYRFQDSDKGRAEVIAFIKERLDIIRSKMPRAFNTLVRGNVEVRRLPPEEEPGAPGAYGGAGSIDGSVPGKFWINLKPGFDHTRYDLPSLTHHEAIPGHVWQGEYANKLPLIRTILSFNAYSEGWALYAEQLADELGVYDDFEVGRLGYLNEIAFRAARLVVDTGLHHKRWSREQARQFFLENTGDR